MKSLLKEAEFRFIENPNTFWDMMDKLAEHRFFTFGYVVAAKVDYPQTKILNPATKRMNSVNDYDKFSQDLGFDKKVNGVIKLSIYNMPWTYRTKYEEFATKRDALYQKYGIEKRERKNTKEKINFGKNGILTYNGDDETKKGHTYVPLNMHNVYPISTTYFLVLEDGSLEPITKEKLPLLPHAVSDPLSRLKNAGATADEIASISNMDYRTFLHSNILFISSTLDDGVPSLFLNSAMPSKMGDVTGVNPQALLDVAKARYAKYLTEERKKTQRLKALIKEQVKKVLKEGTTNRTDIEQWDFLKETVGADTMLDCLFQWASSDDIAQWLKWFEQEGYCSPDEY